MRVALLLAVLACVGCGGDATTTRDEDRNDRRSLGPAKSQPGETISLDTGEAKSRNYDAVSKPQQVTVKFSTSTGKVTVLLFKAEDAEGDDALFLAESDKAIGKANGEEGNFTADVPENTAFRVILRNATQPMKVTLRVTKQPQ